MADVPHYYCPRCEETKETGCPSRGRTVCHDCLDDKTAGRGVKTDLYLIEESPGYIPENTDRTVVSIEDPTTPITA